MCYFNTFTQIARPFTQLLMLRMGVNGGRECVRTSLCGSPAAEKMGIFCPLAMLFMPSIAEIPVWIISSG
jgi:hypothetical protein